MNKDIINISPEDDISDIISKIRAASKKIVAIVPAEDTSVLRSAVNIKLILKTAEEVKKVPVLVTKDSSLVSMASQFNFHIADSLQSKPYIPRVSESSDSAPEEPVSSAEDFIKPTEIPDAILDDISDDVKESKITEDSSSDDSSESQPAPVDDEESAQKSSDKKSKKEKKPSKFPFFSDHKKTIIISSVALVFIAAFLVWALVFAPKVSIKVSIKTSSSNFSETATFVTDQISEDSASGKFFLQEEKVSDEQKIEFKATGSKDIGDKASGKLSVSTFFDAKSSKGSFSIPANTQFVYGGLSYLSNEEIAITWDGDAKNCENNTNLNELTKTGCKKSASISVVAAEPGEKYNLEAGKNDWSAPTFKGISSIFNSDAIKGGNTNVVTVIQQSDIDEARKKLTSTMTESEGKKKLFAKISDSMLIIEDTYKSEISDSKSNVEVDAQVPEGTTPAITQSSIFTVYVVDKVRIEEFISSKATLANDQKIYSVGSPFVEYFTKNGDTFTGKLKTTYKVGPKVTAQDIMEKTFGKKIGEVQSLLKSINGVSSVDIKKSYFWVNRVPTDSNKVEIEVSVEE